MCTGLYLTDKNYEFKSLNDQNCTKAQKDHSRFEIQYPKYLDIENSNPEFQILKFEIRNSISKTTNEEKAFKLRILYCQ